MRIISLNTMQISKVNIFCKVAFSRFQVFGKLFWDKFGDNRITLTLNPFPMKKHYPTSNEEMSLMIFPNLIM